MHWVSWVASRQLDQRSSRECGFTRQTARPFTGNSQHLTGSKATVTADLLSGAPSSTPFYSMKHDDPALRFERESALRSSFATRMDLCAGSSHSRMEKRLNSVHHSSSAPMDFDPSSRDGSDSCADHAGQSESLWSRITAVSSVSRRWGTCTSIAVDTAESQSLAADLQMLPSSFLSRVRQRLPSIALNFSRAGLQRDPSSRRCLQTRDASIPFERPDLSLYQQSERGTPVPRSSVMPLNFLIRLPAKEFLQPFAAVRFSRSTSVSRLSRELEKSIRQCFAITSAH